MSYFDSFNPQIDLVPNIFLPDPGQRDYHGQLMNIIYLQPVYALVRKEQILSVVGAMGTFITKPLFRKTYSSTSTCTHCNENKSQSGINVLLIRFNGF